MRKLETRNLKQDLKALRKYAQQLKRGCPTSELKQYLLSGELDKILKVVQKKESHLKPRLYLTFLSKLQNFHKKAGAKPSGQDATEIYYVRAALTALLWTMKKR